MWDGYRWNKEKEVEYTRRRGEAEARIDVILLDKDLTNRLEEIKTEEKEYSSSDHSMVVAKIKTDLWRVRKKIEMDWKMNKEEDKKKMKQN